MAPISLRPRNTMFPRELENNWENCRTPCRSCHPLAWTSGTALAAAADAADAERCFGAAGAGSPAAAPWRWMGSLGEPDLQQKDKQVEPLFSEVWLNHVSMSFGGKPFFFFFSRLQGCLTLGHTQPTEGIGCLGLGNEGFQQKVEIQET